MSNPSLADSESSFGVFLRLLRKRARITQRELGIATNYSEAQISRFEKDHKPPELTTLVALFIPALGLHDNPHYVARLLELAASGRAENLAGHVVQSRASHVQTFTQDRQLREDPATTLFGREAHVHEAIGLLRQGVRLLTLIGPPGIGKTRLGLAVQMRLANEFADRSAFVPLAAVTSGEQAAAAIASVFELELGANATATQILLAGARNRHALLLLDNAEHLTDLPDLVSLLLTAAPKLTVLVTSRVALRLQYEKLWSVPALALPTLSPRAPLHELAEVPSVKLFIARARAVQPTLELSEENALAISALCVRLDGLPLAIELAAARTRLFAPQALLKRYVSVDGESDRLRWLEHGLRDAAPRHESLARAVRWSFDLLAAAAQASFARFGVFSGGCDFDAAQAVCHADLAIIERLVDASLVQSNPQPDGEPRFTLLQTLREFARHALRETGQFNSAQRAHAQYFSEFSQRLSVGVRGEQQLDWLARGRLEHDNIRAALAFTISEHDADTAVSLAGGMWWFWYRQGFLREGRAWLERALALPQRADEASGEVNKWRALALNGAGAMASEQGDYESANAHHTAGLALRRALGDKAGESIVLHNMALVARCLGDYPRAMDLFQLALPEQPAAQALANIGITAFEMLKFDEALDWLERALVQTNSETNPWSRAFVLGNLADVLRATSALQRAQELGEESLRMFRAMDDKLYILEPLLILAKIALDNGDDAQARALAREVFTDYAELDDQHGIANALFVFARLALREQNAALAALRFGKAVALRATANRVVSPCERADDECMLNALRAQIGETQCDALLQSGASHALDALRII